MAERPTLWLDLLETLGRSLCRWIIEYEARYIVLLSRIPKADPKWLDAGGQQGAVVQTRAM